MDACIGCPNSDDTDFASSFAGQGSASGATICHTTASLVQYELTLLSACPEF
jgi:hypothetical protein